MPFGLPVAASVCASTAIAEIDGGAQFSRRRKVFQHVG